MTENVKGLKRLIKALEKLPKEADDQIAEEVERAAQDIESQAKKDVPVGTPESTGIKGYKGGTLRDSIRVVKKSKKTYSIVADAKSKQKGGRLQPYSAFVEFGTSKMNARPFLYPAFFKYRGELTDSIERAVKKLLDKI